MPICKQDCKKGILDNTIRELEGAGFQFNRVMDDMIMVTENGRAKEDIVNRIHKSFNGHVSGLIDGNKIIFSPSQEYIDYTFNNLPNGKKDFEDTDELMYQLTPQRRLEKAIPELDKYLMDWLKPFGVRFKEFEDLKNRIGVDSIGATDIFNKLIWLSKPENRNVETVPEEFGHMITFLMGERSREINLLITGIDQWSEFPAIKARYMPKYRNEQQVKIEAVGQLIARALVKNYKTVGIGDGTLLTQALDAIKAFFNNLFRMVHYVIPQQDINDNLADQLALRVLKGIPGTGRVVYQLVDNSILPGHERVDPVKALKDNPFAQELVTRFTTGKFDHFKLVGSLALATQGAVYRKAGEPVHDLDFEAYGDDTDFLELLADIRRRGGVPRTKGIKSGNEKTLYSFIIPKDAHATISFENMAFSGGTNWVREYKINGMEGNHTNAMEVDFFWYKTKPSNESKLGRIATANDIFRGKTYLSSYGSQERMFQREKDQKDFVLFNPSYVGVTDPAFIYYQLRDEKDLNNEDAVEGLQEALVDAMTTPEMSELERDMVNTNTGPNTHEALDSNYMLAGIPVQAGVFTKYLQLREQTLNVYKYRRNRTDAAIKRGGPKQTKQDLLILRRKLEELDSLIYGNKTLGKLGLIEEIDNLKAISNIAALAPYVERDLKRLGSLVLSQDIDDIIEAERLVTFYKAAGDFTLKLWDKPYASNPFFRKDEIFMPDPSRPGEVTGEYRLSKQTRDQYSEWKKIAEEHDNRLQDRRKEILIRTVNENPLIQNTFSENGKKREFSKEELINSQTGLKDIDEYSMWVMDVTTGTFSHNGLLPQVMFSELMAEIEEHSAWSRKIASEMDAMLPDVMKEMREFEGGKHTLRNIGIKKLTAVSWNLFKEFTKQGNETGGLVGRTSHEYDGYEEREKEILGRSFLTNTVPAAYKRYTDWRRANSIIINPARLPEIDDPEFVELGAKGDAAYVSYLKGILGEFGYKEMIDGQKQKLRNYQAAREQKIEDIQVRDNTIGQPLTTIQLEDLQEWDNKNNPIHGHKTIEESGLQIGTGPGARFVLNNLKYNHFIPRPTQVAVGYDRTTGKYSFTDLGKSTGYYNETFKKIEANETLRKFYELVKEVATKIRDVAPFEIQSQMAARSLPGLNKATADFLLDKNTSTLKSLSGGFRNMYDNFKSNSGVIKQADISYAHTDEKGVKTATVNVDFLKTHQAAAKSRREIERDKFVLAWNSTKRPFPLGSITKFSTKPLLDFNTESLLLLAEYTHTPLSRADIKAGNIKALKDKVGNSVAIGMIIDDYAVHTVVQSQSFDLPKLTKHFANAAMIYSARQTALPIMNIIKKYYDDIDNPDVNNQKKTIKNRQGDDEKLQVLGIRHRAVRQMANQFERTFLGNLGQKQETIPTIVPRPLSKDENDVIDASIAVVQKQIDALEVVKPPNATPKQIEEAEKEFTEELNRLQTKKYKLYAKKYVRRWNRNIYTSNEIREVGELQELIEKEPLEEQRKIYIDLQANKGKVMTWTAFFDNLFSYINILKLGYNISSMTTNFLEGFTSNMIIAATGEYFDSDEIYYGYKVARYSFLKNITSLWGVENKTGKKSRILVDRFNVIVDSRSDLQKYSNTSSLGKFSRLNPYTINQRTEYINQLPIMVAMLRTVKIKDDKGNEVPVWNAYDYEGVLKPEFRVGAEGQKNIENWENLSGDQYQIFKANLSNAITRAHGNYSELRGMMAKTNSWGKAALMFKTWLPEAIATRFGSSRVDILSGLKDAKGRYRSHTGTSAAFHGVLVGGTLFGPIGFAAGLIGGIAFGKGVNSGVSAGVGPLRESVKITKALFLKSLGMPINFIASVAFGADKALIKQEDFSSWVGKTNKAGKAFTQHDANNMASNIADINIQLGWFLMTLIVKAMFWDDDDEPDSTDRIIHNIAINKIIQLSSQGANYTTLTGFYHNTIGNIAIINWLEDVGKALGAIQDALEGHDRKGSGVNKGESGTLLATKKLILPGIFKDTFLGFETMSETIYEDSPWQFMFDSEEKKDTKKNKGDRAYLRLQLYAAPEIMAIEDEKMREKYVERIVDMELPTPTRLKKLGLTREQYNALRAGEEPEE